MRLQALRARPRRRRLPPELGERRASAVVPNVLDRSFDASAPTAAGLLTSRTSGRRNAGSMLPRLFSRCVVGGSMSASMTAQLVADALVRAIWR
jgi:putative transposase